VLNALRLNFFQTDHAAEAAGNDTAETAAAAPAAEISNDEPQTKEADTMEKTLKIEGMMCAHCQKHVHDALAKMDGVTDVTVDLEGGSADVKATRDIPQDEFQKVIADAGYELVG
jgi:Cu+-exporting ATPase